MWRLIATFTLASCGHASPDGASDIVFCGESGFEFDYIQIIPHDLLVAFSDQVVEVKACSVDFPCLAAGLILSLPQSPLEAGQAANWTSHNLAFHGSLESGRLEIISYQQAGDQPGDQRPSTIIRSEGGIVVEIQFSSNKYRRCSGVLTLEDINDMWKHTMQSEDGVVE